jgi:hypothetical protein
MMNPKDLKVKEIFRKSRNNLERSMTQKKSLLRKINPFQV